MAAPAPAPAQLGPLTIRSVLTRVDKIGCLLFLYSLLKKQVGNSKKDKTQCIKVKKYEKIHRGLMPYQIAYLLYHGPVPADKEISHRCAHHKKDNIPKIKKDRRASPCINPLHFEAATKDENKSRNAHQIALVKYFNGNKWNFRKQGISGPIFVKDWNESDKTFTPCYKSSLKGTCFHLEKGDGCFINVGGMGDYRKGLKFFRAPVQLQLLVDEVNAMFEDSEND